jgi:hypothetical protein
MQRRYLSQSAPAMASENAASTWLSPWAACPAKAGHGGQHTCQPVSAVLRTRKGHMTDGTGGMPRSFAGFYAQEVRMKRVVVAGVAAGVVACLGAYGALAASPKIESAVKTFKGIAGDPGKTKTFCEMVKTMDASGEKEDPAAEAKITGLMKQLGPDFESAWNASDGLDDNSEDGKAYNAAMDDLAEKCPQ